MANARPTAFIFVALALAACSAPQRLGEEYRNVPRTAFAFAGNDYRIFDKPHASKLVITPSVARSMGSSVIRGVTFGAFGAKVSQDKIEAAVAAYLESSGRACTTSAATPIAQPQWEVTYSCTIKYTAVEETPTAETQPGAGFSAVPIESK